MIEEIEMNINNAKYYLVEMKNSISLLNKVLDEKIDYHEKIYNLNCKTDKQKENTMMITF